MQFVNLTTHSVYTSFSGRLGPGQTSPDGGERRLRLEKAMQEVVSMCGNSLGIRLNSREADFLSRIISLDEKGGGFNPASLPKEVRNDPTGEKRAAAEAHRAQMEEMKAIDEANKAKAAEEAEINGEELPSAPSKSEGTKPKSAFDEIMAENARIAAGEIAAPSKEPIEEEIPPPLVEMAGNETAATEEKRSDTPEAPAEDEIVTKAKRGRGRKSKQ